MGLFRQLIRVAAAVLSTVAVIASPAQKLSIQEDRCEGYNGVEGTCKPSTSCPIIQQEFFLLPLPEFIKRHGSTCDYDLEENKLLCCPENSTASDLCQGYNGVEGTCQNHLFCTSLQQDAEALTFKSFMERHASGCASVRPGEGTICCPKPGCVYRDEVYRHNDILSDECYPLKCMDGAMKPLLNYTTGNPCTRPYGEKCYYYNATPATWCDARRFCLQAGGDLAGPDFNTVLAFTKSETPAELQTWVWIGVRDNKWLTGQQPQQQEWGEGDPQEADLCGFIDPNYQKLADYPCHYTLPFTCQVY